MVTMETEVEELLSLVISTGREIDESVAQLQTMSEVTSILKSNKSSPISIACSLYEMDRTSSSRTFCNITGFAVQPGSNYNTHLINYHRPKFLQHPMSNCYNGYMVNNDIITFIVSYYFKHFLMCVKRIN